MIVITNTGLMKIDDKQIRRSENDGILTITCVT